jgi:hypothetical protein
MLAAATPNPPVIAFFVLFVSYGGWLLLLLTALFWYHSGLATIGLAFLLFVAPVMMLLFAIQLYRHRYLSPFHRGAFVACVVYLLFPIALLLLRGIWVARYGP